LSTLVPETGFEPARR